MCNLVRSKPQKQEPIKPASDVDYEIESLGLFAAQCDVWAHYPATTPSEREQLAQRAARYRDLQLAALSETNLAERIAK